MAHGHHAIMNPSSTGKAIVTTAEDGFYWLVDSHEVAILLTRSYWSLSSHKEEHSEPFFQCPTRNHPRAVAHIPDLVQ